MKKARKLKNSPGQGRKPEGRIRGHLFMLPAAWSLLDSLPGSTRGKRIERLLAANAAAPHQTSGNPPVIKEASAPNLQA